jgi:putative transposase
VSFSRRRRNHARAMELSRLGREARLKLENEILKKSDGVLREGCAMKFAWIERHRSNIR